MSLAAVVRAQLSSLLDFQLFLKSVQNEDGTQRWSVEQINAIPIGGGAITVVTIWVYSFMSDYFQTRWLIVMGQAVSTPFIFAIVLKIPDMGLGTEHHLEYLECTHGSKVLLL